MAHNLDDSAISVFTDGSSKERPRRGGVGFRIVTTGAVGYPEVWDSDLPGYLGATNNSMELQACILALKTITARRPPIEVGRFNKVVLYTDSSYVHKNLPVARQRWARQGWYRASGPPVLNAKQWKEFLALERRAQRLGLPVRVEWVPGKSSEHTKAVDKLAKASAERPQSLPLSGGSVARKLTEKPTQAGSVPMEAQILEIRIISGDYEPLARCSRYRYEVVAGDLEGEADFASSKLTLRRNHRYRVRMNDEQRNPWIEEALEDLTERERT